MEVVKLENLLEKNMERHNYGLSPYACLDKEAVRFTDEEEDLRSPFFRDIDRILYTYAYVRYSDKTQVYSMKNNDHITKRMLHVQYVSKIARTIGRALGLNEDLIEAAGLGHDLGHVPFGHFGEAVLNQISLENGEGYFHHNVESVRVLMELERGGEGCNLTLQVLDAIMCHNGEFVSGEYHPKKKSKEEFLEEYHNTYVDKETVKTLVPMTLEGCVVRISDIIAYLGRDIEDACMLGVFQKEDIPKEIREVLGTKNRDIVNTIILDIIKNSLGKPYIKLSKKVYEAIVSLKKFNYQNLYDKALSKEERAYITEMFSVNFKVFLEDLEKENKESKIYKNFLDFKKEKYICSTSKKRMVLDFLAGMTDDYFVTCYHECKNQNLNHTKIMEASHEV